MKVLFVNENIGGHATVHTHLRDAVARTPGIDADFLDVPRASGLRRAASTKVPGLSRLDLDLQPLRAQLALSEWVRRQVEDRAASYDVLHVYTGNAALRLVPVMRRVPTVIATDATNATNAYRLPYRNPTRFTPASVAISKRLERPVYAHARVVLASTGWVASSLREDYGVPAERVRVLPFGIGAPDFGPGAAPGVRPRQRLPRVVFVGRQLQRKGALRLVALHQAHLADVCELVLVTPEQVPDGRHLSVVADVTPGSGRLWEILRGAAAFAFPSPIDQASNAVIEALAAGLPVVGLRQGAMGEMVPPSAGRLVDLDDDDALVGALRDLVTDEDLRVRLGEGARAHFLETYELSRTMDRLVGVLRDVARP